MRWQVGYVAIVDCPRSRSHGERVTIVACGVKAWCEQDGDYVGYAIDRLTEDGTLPLVFEVHELRPTPYDGNQASTWEQCIFKPRELVT